MTYRSRNALPPEIVAEFDEAKAKDDPDHRNLMIRSLRAAKWTMQSIANGTGLTRERVRQINLEGEEGEELLSVPSPPAKAVKPAPVYVEPSPDGLARLLELQPFAQKVRSNSPRFREEAEEYTKLLWHEHHVNGVTIYRLGKRLGITHGAVRFRLVRYGYITPESGTSRVYTPINPENRAGSGTEVDKSEDEG